MKVFIALFLLFFFISCSEYPCVLSIEKEYYSPDSNFRICSYTQNCGIISGPLQYSFVKKGDSIPNRSNFLEEGGGISLKSWNKNNELVFKVSEPEFKVINSFHLKLSFYDEHGENIKFYYSDYEINKNNITFSPSFSQIFIHGFEKFIIDKSNIEEFKFEDGKHFYKIINPITKTDFFMYQEYKVKRIRHIFGFIIGKKSLPEYLLNK